MRVFIDTSAFLSILDADDKFHDRAKSRWAELVTSDALFFSNNYILVETFALVQHRFGMKAVRAFNDDILPLINVEWVDETTHKAAVSALEVAGRRKLSLVDCVSFETMRQLGIKTAFTFDPHFAKQGFRCIP
ncbi:MAG: type II toxin-antitoxin system VapC family toxin [Thermodesulfobacteriota bacterium]